MTLFDEAGAPVPDERDLDALRTAAAGCQACDLYKTGTQTVFGEGSGQADVVLVGEQPGDQEDKQGRPFVGPAGRVLDEALEAAGIDRTKVYVTNVVKHFKWTAQGKRRIHKKPNAEEITACKPWLSAELESVQPRMLICLGATAAQALLGRTFRVTKDRGRLVESPLAPMVLATVHPSSILRAADDESRRIEMKRFVEDLQVAADALAAAA
ncbi:MAG: UdgX family uracil-DNA binding protein [Actinobacteria bacterium]|nr:MAG: UdgX family uracil-DNA binding protein [Actinomycetota bacterium]